MKIGKTEKYLNTHTKNNKTACFVLLDSEDLTQKEAGQKAKEKISQQCDRMYNIQFVDLQQKDVGDMSVEEINNHIKPQLGI